MSRDLKETKELVFAVKTITLDVLKAAEDGLSFDDINIVFKNLKVLKDAVEGITEIGEEMKDLDAEEIKELVVMGTDLIFSIVMAAKSLAEARKKLKSQLLIGEK